MLWVLEGKASSKNGRTKARMGLYFLALEQRKGTESELLCNQSEICGSSGGLRQGTHTHTCGPPVLHNVYLRFGL